MHIKKLELQGFKSFPDRTKIIIHPGITAVIGPNGTGKSNIVDAFLWVLGGQRLKALRGDRSEDIIFNGNSQKAPMSMADVSLFLQDDREEIIINHRVFRSGESDYRLNGKSVRLKDIQDTLWKYSIGEKEYFVIEQGSIGLFLTSKPIEKRGLLEEAAGTAYYKEKKRQAQNKLTNSEQNLIRLEDIIIEVEKAKNSLRRQAGAAEKYRKTREKIRELTSFHYRHRIEELEINAKEAANHYRSHLEKENALFLQLKECERSASSERGEVWSMEKKAKEENEQIYRLTSRISRLEADKEKNAVEISNLNASKKRNIHGVSDFEQEMNNLENERKEITKGLSDLETDFSGQKKELQNAETLIHQTSNEHTELEKNLESMRDTYYQKLSEHTEIRNDRAKIEKELELIFRQEEKLGSHIQEEKDTLRRKQEEVLTAEKSLAELNDFRNKTSEDFQKKQEELQKIQASLEKTQSLLGNLKDQKKGTSLQLETLKKWEKQERLTETTDIEESPGLLADIIDSTPEYAPLFDILWKEEAKASLIRVEDLLKKWAGKKLNGRFLLLPPASKNPPPHMAFKNPLVKGFLKSTLRSPSPYKDNLFRLTDAAIVDDLQTALELWQKYSDLNFITMDGDILLSSGLLKIGEKKEGLFMLARDLKNLETTLSELDSQITPLNKKRQKEEKKLRLLEEEKQECEEKQASLNRTLEEKTKDLQYMKADEKKIQTNLGLLENEWRMLSTGKKELQEKQDNVHQKSESLGQDIKSLKEKIEKLEKNLTLILENNDRQRHLFFEIKSRRDLTAERISNLTQRIKSIDTRKENFASRLNDLRNDITLGEEKLKKILTETTDIEKQIKTLEHQKKETELSLTKNETTLDKKRSELKETENKLEKIKVDYEASKEERIKWEIKKAERDRDIANLEESCWQELKKNLEEVKNSIALTDLPEMDIGEELENLKEKLQKFSNVNLMAEEEYQAQKKRHDFLTQQKNDLVESIQSTKEAIKKIDDESKIQFLRAIQEVDKNFDDVFSTLFKGGKAGIKLTDESNPLESGIDIFAQPPGKKVQTIALLSGGEKSLTSLAFFFALFRYKPTPFCILDEVDAALDDVNLSRFLDLMRLMKEKTQFIIVTHNFKTMEVADYIYGTTMSEPSKTQVYSMKIDKKKGLPEKTELPDT
ncbi:MAG: chromosome segregation protein SMC [Candidatus Aminicenantes bacterium]|nr:chromosome segregation protein SMC [Candidatus Aminicenantes bacterium]